MCTVTWWRDEGGALGVFFNRDEARTRPPSEPVAVRTAGDGTRFLSPRDPAAGGTWLMANEHGLVVGVLNHYAAAGALPPGRRSRGGIPLAFAAGQSVDEVASDLQRFACDDFAPFILIAWDPNSEASWTWDGSRLSRGAKPDVPCATSSYRTPDVLAWRRQRYVELVATDHAGPQAPERAGVRDLAQRLEAYHHDTSHADGAFNVRMRRADARTESICRVDVTPRRVHFWHQREAGDRLEALDAHEAAVPRR